MHSHGDRFQTDGLALEATRDPEESLYDYSGFKFRCPQHRGSRSIRGIRVGETDQTWSATWSEVTDWRRSRGAKRVVDHDVRLRLTMLGQPGTEVIAGTAPGQRYLDERDRGETMTVVCARRKGGEELDRFVSLIEPYRGEPVVRALEPLSVAPEDETAVALKVTTRASTDYILSANNAVARTVQDGGRAVVTDAEFAVASFAGDDLRYLFLAAATFLKCAGETIELPREPTGTILDFGDDDKTLLVESDTMPLGDALMNRALFISHREGRSSLTIESVEPVTDSRYRVKLAGFPHLSRNILLVRSVDKDGIVVEPPPVLPRKKQEVFNVYRRSQDGTVELIGPLLRTSVQTSRDEWGTDMTRQHRVHIEDSGSIKPGDEIALSMLCVRRDTFRVPNVAFHRW